MVDAIDFYRFYVQYFNNMYDWLTIELIYIFGALNFFLIFLKVTFMVSSIKLRFVLLNGTLMLVE